MHTIHHMDITLSLNRIFCKIFAENNLQTEQKYLQEIFNFQTSYKARTYMILVCSISLPRVLMITSFMGMLWPDISSPFLTIMGKPEQHGTSI